MLPALATVEYSIAATPTNTPTDAGVVMALNSNDTLELGLRRLAAYVYMERTHDVTGRRARAAAHARRRRTSDGVNSGFSLSL